MLVSIVKWSFRKNASWDISVEYLFFASRFSAERWWLKYVHHRKMWGVDWTLTYLGCGLALSDSCCVMGFVPLSEWCWVDHDNAVLNECLCSDKLVVTGIVDDINNSGFSSTVLTAPSEVTVVQSESTGLEVASSDTHGPHSSDTDLGSPDWKWKELRSVMLSQSESSAFNSKGLLTHLSVGCWTTKLELSLHTDWLSFTTSGTAFVPVILRDTCY